MLLCYLKEEKKKSFQFQMHLKIGTTVVLTVNSAKETEPASNVKHVEMGKGEMMFTKER